MSKLMYSLRTHFNITTLLPKSKGAQPVVVIVI